MTDDQILHKAFTEDWVVITNDKDFGEKVYRERQPHRGIIFLRLADERSGNKIDVLQRLLTNHISQLANRFIVVTETHVRFANL